MAIQITVDGRSIFEDYSDYFDGTCYPIHSYEEGRELLLSCLTTDQKETLEKKGYFDVQGQSGRRYRITKLFQYNVEVFGAGILLCAGPRNVPLYDYLAGQKLWLENDEVSFWRVANKKRF